MPGKEKLKLSITTPEKEVVNTEADMVVLPASDGEMGVLPRHIAYAAVLTEGILRYTNNGQEETFAILGGFVEISNNNVAVFAEDAALAGEIDAEKERQEIQKARSAILAHEQGLDLEALRESIKHSALKIRLKKRTRK